MAYLADVEQLPKIRPGPCQQRNLAEVVNVVSGLPRMHGANLSYHILGAASAEIPMTQISTYLAAGFMRRFKEAVGKDQLQSEALQGGKRLGGRHRPDGPAGIQRRDTRMPEPDAAGYRHRGSALLRRHAQGNTAGSLGQVGQHLVRRVRGKAQNKPRCAGGGTAQELSGRRCNG